MNKHFPFTAICGQDDFKQALLLCMIDNSLGGVLALGDKGTGKTTTVRALSDLMKRTRDDFSFVNLPIGATEDRIIGSVKLDTLLNEKSIVLQKGLLGAANHGVLYIDEVNLLNDYLMDVLLDAASGGGYHLERDSMSYWVESKFCIVGTMNPEEGDLRPQLLDRFGLCVSIKTPADKAIRMEIVSRRLAFDADPVKFQKQYHEQEQDLAKRIIQAKGALPNITIPSQIREEIAETCIQHAVEGLRADILLLKAARAHAAFYYKTELSSDDVHQVMPFVLAHRSKSYAADHNSRQNSRQQLPREEKEEDTASLRLT